MRRRLRNIRKRRTGRLHTEDAAAVLAQIKGMVPAFNVFFEFARPGISFGQPPVMAFRLIDILYHTRLQDIGQVIECLEAINEAFARVRQDASAKFCGFDNQGHCLIAPETQQALPRCGRAFWPASRGACEAGAFGVGGVERQAVPRSSPTAGRSWPLQSLPIVSPNSSQISPLNFCSRMASIGK